MLCSVTAELQTHPTINVSKTMLVWGCYLQVVQYLVEDTGNYRIIA